MPDANVAATESILVQLNEEAIELLRENGKLVIPTANGAGSVVLSVDEFPDREDADDADAVVGERGVR
jgi:hypothetical protein